MLENSVDFVVAWLGLAKLGAILVGLNTRWKPLEVAEALERTRPQLVLADGEHLETVRAAGGIEPLPLADFRVGARRHGRLLRAAAARADDPISFIFTSGTTGHPKAVMQTHGDYVLTGQAYPWWLGLEPGSASTAACRSSTSTRRRTRRWARSACGGGLVLVERFSASRFWDDVRDVPRERRSTSSAR